MYGNASIYRIRRAGLKRVGCKVQEATWCCDWWELSPINIHPTISRLEYSFLQCLLRRLSAESTSTLKCLNTGSLGLRDRITYSGTSAVSPWKPIKQTTYTGIFWQKWAPGVTVPDHGLGGAWGVTTNMHRVPIAIDWPTTGSRGRRPGKSGFHRRLYCPWSRIGYETSHAAGGWTAPQRRTLVSRRGGRARTILINLLPT